MDAIIDTAVKLAATLLSLLIVAYTPALVGLIRARVKNATAREALAYMATVLGAQVAARADAVRHLKSTDAWSPATAREVLRDAVAATLRAAPAQADILRRNLGGSRDLQALLAALAEAEVEALRRGPAPALPPTPSAPPPAPAQDAPQSPEEGPGGRPAAGGGALAALVLGGALLGLLGPLHGCGPHPVPAGAVTPSPLLPEAAPPATAGRLLPVAVGGTWGPEELATVAQAVRDLSALGVALAAGQEGAVVVEPLAAGPGCFVAAVVWAPDRVAVDTGCARAAGALRQAVQHGVGRALGLGAVCGKPGELEVCSPVGYGPAVMGARLRAVGPAAAVFTGAPAAPGVTDLDVLEARRARALRGDL